MSTRIFEHGNGRRLTRLASVPAPVPRLARRPTVSVIIPCYNYGRYLGDSVPSALDQDGVDVEVIVVDDRSTDDSAEVAQRLADADPRVALIRHATNAGHVVTFNTGFAEATGEFIVRLDADDLLTPGSLARSVALFDAYPSVGLVYGNPRIFMSSTPPAPRLEIRGWSLWSGHDWVAERCRTGDNCITTPEAMVRGTVAQRIGPLSTRLKFAQDMEWWVRAAAVSDVGRVDGADQALHRDHPTSMSVTDGAPLLVDLRERRTVFDVLFDGLGGEFADAELLHNLARRALASEALWWMTHAYDRGRTERTNLDELLEFVHETYPAPTDLRQWRALQQRKRVGARLSPLMPGFVASVVVSKAQRELRRMRRERAGV